jgi:hypothetical protein
MTYRNAFMALSTKRQRWITKNVRATCKAQPEQCPKALAKWYIKEFRKMGGKP